MIVYLSSVCPAYDFSSRLIVGLNVCISNYLVKCVVSLGTTFSNETD